MRLALVLASSALFGSFPALAQKATPEDLQFPAWEHKNLTSVCPLDMHVRQGIGSRMMAANDHGVQVEMFAARLRLLLKDLRPDRPGLQMAAATVTVHGLNGAQQIVPAVSHSTRPANAVKTLSVPLTPEGEPEMTGEMLLPGFTATLMVDLDSVTYSDGSVEKFAGSSACHVPPDFLMRVGGS